MVANLISSTKTEDLPELEILTEKPQKNVISLEEFTLHPPERMEWVDGKLVEKTGTTFKHGVAQAELASTQTVLSGFSVAVNELLS